MPHRALLGEHHILQLSDRGLRRCHAGGTADHGGQGDERCDRVRFRNEAEDIDYPSKREFDKAQVRQLGTCRWVAEHQNILITGKTGTGKTYVACALARQACRKGHRAIYCRAARLFSELTLARADGTCARVLAKIARADVFGDRRCCNDAYHRRRAPRSHDGRNAQPYQRHPQVDGSFSSGWILDRTTH